MIQVQNFKAHSVPKLKRFQGFVFVSDSAIELEAEPIPQLQLTSNSSWLTEVEIGNFINVEQIYAPRNIIRQLRNLKFKPKQQGQLVSRSETGSVVVNFNNRSIGIGAEIAQRIVVTFVSVGK